MLSPEAIRFVERTVSVTKMRADMRELHLIERVPNASNYRKSARCAERMLRRAGLEEVERIQYPLDGRTGFGDLVMPKAWDCREGYVELLGPSGDAERVADWAEHPLAVAMWSASTPPGGAVGELVREDALADPAEAAGKVVLTSEAGSLRKTYARFKGSGALGLVHCGGARWLAPEGYHWENAWTDHTGWYPHGSPVALPCLTVNYATYRRLAALAEGGSPPKVRICVQASAKEGTMDLATGILPGRTEQEFACLAHMYEPFIFDNCSGAAAMAETARIVKAMFEQGVLNRQERTLRLLAGWEYYGFNAYYQTQTAVRERTFAAANFDGTGLAHWVAMQPMEFVKSSPSSPSFLDAFLAEVVRSRLKHRLPHLRLKELPSHLGDDNFLSAHRFGIPVFWIHQPPGPGHHMENPGQDAPLDEKALRAIVEAWSLALSALLAAGEEEILRMVSASAHRSLSLLSEETAELLALGGAAFGVQPAERLEYHRIVETTRLDSAAALAPGSQRVQEEIAAQKQRIEQACDRHLEKAGRMQAAKQLPPAEPPSRSERRAANMVASPKILGRVYCMARLPEEQRPPLPPLAAKVEGWFDGERDVAACVRLGFQENRAAPSPADFRQWARWTERMAQAGYFGLRYRHVVSKDELLEILRRLGVKAGDWVVAHVALTGFGKLEEGADTVIDALIEAVGPEGTVAMPTFTGYHTLEQVGDRKGQGEVFDPEKSVGFVGQTPDVFRRRGDVVRSLHPTHSVAFWGKQARRLAESQGPEDRPFAWEGPWGEMLRRNAWYLFLGAERSAASFWHALEDFFDLAYLGVATGKRLEGGQAVPYTVSAFPTGPRSFYKDNGLGFVGEMEREAGLRWEEDELPAGKVYGARMQDLFRAAKAVLRKRPDALLWPEGYGCDFSDAGRKALMSKAWRAKFEKLLQSRSV